MKVPTKYNEIKKEHIETAAYNILKKNGCSIEKNDVRLVVLLNWGTRNLSYSEKELLTNRIWKKIKKILKEYEN